jgi:hypothetical protein
MLNPLTLLKIASQQRSMATKNRAILFWILGAACIFLAMASATGARGDSMMFGYAAAFLLTLVGGLLWISIMHMTEA